MIGTGLGTTETELNARALQSYLPSHFVKDEPEEIMRRHVRCMVGIAFLAGFATGAAPDAGLKSALETVKPAQVLEHIKVLASNDFEGRGPGTLGEEKTIAYLTGQFQKMGLKPGNPDGTFVQNVPLLGFQAKQVTGAFLAGGRVIGLSFPTDFVAVSRRLAEKVTVEKSDVVFVGYGVVAPEYGWDDYKGLDVRGKTLIMLINDPAVPDPNDPAKLDPAFFKGRAMTYYGRWTYKYEIASEKGAAAAILVHETGPAGYPFEVVKGSWSRENFDIAQPDGSQAPARVAVEGWITFDTAKELFQASGRDLAALKRSATRRDFRPELLGSTARFEVINALREVKSRNVVARIEGADPALKNDTVIYTAHWDHLGRDPALQGDQIYNGAADNASGVAAVLEIARALAQVRPAPKRSILFLAVTAEEKGLLGAKYYASHPLYPLERTLADINLDVINLWGPTRDIISIGMGNSSLDDLLVEIAKSCGRTVVPDADPEKGYYFRSDHFEFAKQGVPALDPKGGRQYVGKSSDFGKRKQDEYTAKDYHKVTDEVKADWDLSGAVDDIKLLAELGYRIAQGDRYPEWKPDSEFRAKREAMLKATKP
jgi:Zn-dependent M28 family amino/carboxypeptidase